MRIHESRNHRYGNLTLSLPSRVVDGIPWLWTDATRTLNLAAKCDATDSPFLCDRCCQEPRADAILVILVAYYHDGTFPRSW